MKVLHTEATSSRDRVMDVIKLLDIHFGYICIILFGSLICFVNFFYNLVCFMSSLADCSVLHLIHFFISPFVNGQNSSCCI